MKTSAIGLVIFSSIILAIIIINPRERLNAIEKNNKINPYSSCLLMSKTTHYPKCKVGDGEISAIVLGDEHGNSLFTAVANTNNKGATVQWTYADCFAGYKTKKQEYQGCRKFITAKLKAVKKYKNIPVIFINQMATAINDDELKENISYYQNIICKISESNPVYVVQKIPAMEVNVLKYLAITDSDYSISINKYEEQLQTIKPILNTLSKKCNATILDPTPYLCEDGNCLGSLNKKPLYYDKNHMNEYGNSLLIPMFQEIFN